MRYPKPEERGRRIGILGLGTGVLAVYGRSQDTMRFWEIDPQVIGLAKGPDAKFSYLADTTANVEVIEGDGRLGLAQDTGPGYDVLVVDVFAGDAIPIHIVTREAFELCMSRLNGADSVLIFHISNRVLDLTSVMLGFSRASGVPIRFYMNYNSEYAVFSRNPKMLDLAGPDQHAYPWEQVPSVLWTDDFSSPIQVMRH
jgi:spermidine synthase